MNILQLPHKWEKLKHFHILSTYFYYWNKSELLFKDLLIEWKDPVQYRKIWPHFCVPNHTFEKNLMEPTISGSLPSLVKKTCMTTKKKGKRREPSSLPHIRGARLLPSAGSLLLPFIRPVLSSPNEACACTRAHACLLEPRALKGACVWGRAKGWWEGRKGMRVHVCGVALAYVRARAWRTGIRVPRSFFLLLILSGGSPASLFLQVCLSPCRKGDSRGSARGRPTWREGPVGHIFTWINKCQANDSDR